MEGGGTFSERYACDAFYVDWLTNRRSKLTDRRSVHYHNVNFLAVAHADDQTRLEPQTDDGTARQTKETTLLFTCWEEIVLKSRADGTAVTLDNV